MWSEIKIALKRRQDTILLLCDKKRKTRKSNQIVSSGAPRLERSENGGALSVYQMPTCTWPIWKQFEYEDFWHENHSTRIFKVCLVSPSNFGHLYYFSNIWVTLWIFEGYNTVAASVIFRAPPYLGVLWCGFWFWFSREKWCLLGFLLKQCFLLH